MIRNPDVYVRTTKAEITGKHSRNTQKTTTYSTQTQCKYNKRGVVFYI